MEQAIPSASIAWANNCSRQITFEPGRGVHQLNQRKVIFHADEAGFSYVFRRLRGLNSIGIKSRQTAQGMVPATPDSLVPRCPRQARLGEPGLIKTFKGTWPPVLVLDSTVKALRWSGRSLVERVYRSADV
jgi:hypothetical protein